MTDPRIRERLSSGFVPSNELRKRSPGNAEAPTAMIWNVPWIGEGSSDWPVAAVPSALEEVGQA
jgi:hypothetical protein